MTKYIALVFGVGIALIVAGGVGRGFDAVTVTLLVSAIATAALGIAVSRRFASGAAGPAQCEVCGKLIAPSAPYCKHCGAAR